MKKLFLPVLSAATLSLALLPAAFSASAASVEILSTQEWDFSALTAEEIAADFNAAFTMENSTPRFETIGDEERGHWFLDESEGALVRRGDLSEGGSTSNVAVLTYMTKQFVNFRATVEYRQGPTNWGWAALAFRQSDQGMTGMDDGAYCFVQRGGQASVWGRYCGSSNAIESQPIAGYDGNAKHTMTVEVIGNDLNLYVDGTLARAHTLPSSFYYEGYISLLSMDNDSAFYSLKIEELSEPEIAEKPEIPPVPAADTPDSLDQMADVKPFDELNERPKAEQPAGGEGENGGNGQTPAEKTGCGAFLPSAALPCGLLGAVLLFKRRK